MLLQLLQVVAWVSAVAGFNASIARSNHTCEGTLNSSRFSLTSPGFPTSYPPGLLCSWTVETAPSTCGLALDLGTLQLPPCPSDTLEVGGVPLCGDLERVVHLPLTGSRTSVVFRGDPNGGEGFNISAEQTECGSRVKLDRQGADEGLTCETELYGDNVVIQSPGYPSSYPPNARCRYTIRRTDSDVCQVEVTFENTTVETSDGCYKDRIEIQGDRLCGVLTGVRTYGIDDALEVTFVSDDEGSGKFKLLARQIKCADTPIVVDAPENDKQDVVVDCVPPPEGYPRVRRPFPPFPLPGGANRNYPSQGYIPQNAFRRDPPPQFPSQRPPINPYFRYPQQEYLPSEPFRPDYSLSLPPNIPNVFYSFTPSSLQPPLNPFPQAQQCCGRIYTDSHFLLVSPGFPHGQPTDCIYTIQRYSPLTFQLRLNFRYFRVGQDTGSGCVGGALEIDGGRICGCKTGMIWTSQFIEAESAKVLHLRLDSDDKLFSGFVIEVYQDDSYSRFKRGETNPNEFTYNVTQYVETYVEREPLVQVPEVDRSHSQLWDSRQSSDLCVRWTFQDLALLAKEALWSLYQCPAFAPASASTSASLGLPDSDVIACRTCNYFCRQNCRCC